MRGVHDRVINKVSIYRGSSFICKRSFSLTRTSRVRLPTESSTYTDDCRSESFRRLNPSSYITLLQKCGLLHALSDGMRTHMCITVFGLERNACIQSSLLHMYAECGALMDARQFFNTMLSRNQFSWNVMIRSYLRSGQEQEVFTLFEQMHTECMIPDTFIFVSIISACSSQTCVIIGMHTHSYAVSVGLDVHFIVATSLVNMYGKHGMVEDALKQFDTMPERNVASSNAMITACSSNGQAQFAVEIYVRMHAEAVLPDKVTFVSILRACAALGLLLEGRSLHATIAYTGFESDVILETALLDLYGKCNSLEIAQGVFNEMQDRNTVSWTALVSAYAQNGELENVLSLYGQMHQECVLGDKVMLVSILDACACEAGLRQGKLLHACIAGSSLEVEVVVGTALVNMYGKCCSLDCARRIFDMIQEPNDYSWNTMFAGYVLGGHVKEALELLGLMQRLGKVTHELTTVSILQLCASHGAEAEGKQVHAYIVSDSLESSVVQIALVEFYAKCKSLCDVGCIFDRILERTTAAWNAMIGSCAENGQKERSFQVFEQMLQECALPNRATFVSILGAFSKPWSSAKGKQTYSLIIFAGSLPDNLIEVALINEYGKDGRLENAWSIFDGLPTPNIIAWNAIIAAAFQNGKFMDGIQLFLQMPFEGVIADKVILLIILDACVSESSLATGKQVHLLCMGIGCDRDVSVGTALINMYGQCGSLTDSQRVFDELSQRNLFTWTCMIAVVAQHGHGVCAILLFEGMQQEGMWPDKVTFTSILCACARAGMTDFGRCQLLLMKSLYGVLPVADHFNCINDLLGKAGQVDELEAFVKSIPVQPTVTTWTILLDACKVHSDVVHAEAYARHCFEMNPEDTALFVALSSVYVAACRNVASGALSKEDAFEEGCAKSLLCEA